MAVVADITRRAIDEALAEAEERLRIATPSPAVRELRVRLGTLSRVVRGWDHVPPHDAQIAAMLECALDLRAVVERACEPREPAASARRASRPPRTPSARPATARTTRPPPRRDASMRTTRPPPRRRADGKA
jgi:hypothetical protein